PAIMETYVKLENKPDVVMINGHGIAHPLFCGIASHVGVLLKGPATIGVAGSKLCGEYDEAPEAEGEWSALKYKGKVVGAVLLTRRGCKPIFVSPGHKISLKSSVEIVKHFITSHRLPLPLQRAHHLANSERLKFANSKLHQREEREKLRS
ncbi:MAG: endonuclease V, partial [Candidatus Brockarchaeota archaeon]|nr:endonuclease V [Candidatus Brockarchaeota archaeon]